MMRSLLFMSVAVSFVGCTQNSPKIDDATNHVINAQEALDAGDQEKAIAELTASIQSRPTTWALFQRAQLYVATREDDLAIADCKAGLALDDEHPSLHWLYNEMMKPSGQRFKGPNAKSPSMTK